MTAAAPTAVPAIRLIDIDKAFGPVQANRRASLEVARGEIHALVGENGAGKSTLMRVLSGMYAPDAGRMEVAGRDVTGWSTAAAIDAGVGMVHQHFMLVPTLTVAEIVMLGRELTKRGQLDRRRAERESPGSVPRLVSSCASACFRISRSAKRSVEILKTLYRGARFSFSTSPRRYIASEIEELWTVLRRMRDRGETIVSSPQSSTR
jgi:simple sugar transport system ATP-binding protein